ncbi:DUF3055 domain-containing protein [Alteribacillus sp. HJP-4]|uniref:DUF3055 domain-containing protein n=1 Tax=Alteribacillus sp. HJP-4 TaxID=2775394 RepID=UPI0035CCFB1C
MEFFDKLYEEFETTGVRFVGLSTEESRYDFGIVYTDMFFGKPLVICMQTGRSVLLGHEDTENEAFIKKSFRIESDEDTKHLSEYFKEIIPGPTLYTQY